MSRKLTKELVNKNKDDAIESLSRYLSDLIESKNKDDLKRADILSFWIRTYIRFLSKEETFNPRRIIGYSRGDIVKADFGYRIGNEEGGLHYAVVIDNNNSKSSGTLTVVPLSSKRPNRKVHSSSVDLGTELFRELMSKHDRAINDIKRMIQNAKNAEDDLEKQSQILAKADEDMRNLDMLHKEIMGMKQGSVALVSQITTISKIRVYDPVYAYNTLYGIRLSSTALGRINEKIIEKFIHT